MNNQNTLKNSFTLSGKGLHTGLSLTARFLPAEASTGIRLCRRDLPGQPTHEALATLVSETSRGTVLTAGDWRVSTVEHALSALYAMQIDNCLIELDGLEMPILDGSAKPFVEAILKAGIQPQEAEAKELVIKETIEYCTETGTKIVIEPADSLYVDVVVDFSSPILGESRASLTTLQDYPQEIASARTFCFVREVMPLLRLGYIKGGDLENAIVIYDQEMSQEQFDALVAALGQTLDRQATDLGYLTPLNYENEPARHKLLDLLGDISLLGKRLRGHVTAYKPGHTANTAFAKQLLNSI